MAISRIETNSIAPSQTLTTPIIATTMGVGGATPAASGSGITFPATQSASTNANTLDDYEEGTWTPTGNGVTITVAAASYVKVGRVVYFNVDITMPSTANGSSFQIASLPFTVTGSSNYAGATLAYTDGTSGATVIAATFLIYAGNTYIDARKNDGSGYTNANFSASRIILSGCYLAAS